MTQSMVERLSVGFGRLVVERGLSEKIVIHDERGILAIVQWTKKGPGHVSVCIEAPRGVCVDREEVFERKHNGD